MRTGLQILVVGSGGREHALAWALSRCENVRQVFVAPGNPGATWMGGTKRSKRAPCGSVAIKAEDGPTLSAFARERKIDLTIVGPELPLARGIVNMFRAWHRPVFGPTREAAKLESSKAFAKDFMRDHEIPTADYATFTDSDAACAFAKKLGGRVVVKADGLAAGKGVFVCDEYDEAVAAIKRMLIDQEFGKAGARIILEERLSGPELSAFAITDGSNIWMLPCARDHKRLLDGDKGPNTGGMGAFSPVPDVTPEIETIVRDRIFRPTISGMAARGTPYTGVLFAGLMLTADGPKVLEFNCRFGDPETQCLMPLLTGDIAEVFLACAKGNLAGAPPIGTLPGACVSVIAASGNYPGPSPEHHAIRGLDDADAGDNASIIFHAGTMMRDGEILTAGGRVLCVSACGESVEAAAQTAYARLEHISFEGMQFRRDIGKHAGQPA